MEEFLKKQKKISIPQIMRKFKITHQLAEKIWTQELMRRHFEAKELAKQFNEIRATVYHFQRRKTLNKKKDE